MAVANAAKARRHLLGLATAPVKATKVYRKAMDFDHKDIETRSWILITPEGKRCHLNSYNGALGKNVDPATFTYEADPKTLSKKLKSYEEVTDPTQIPEFVELVSVAPEAPVEPPTQEEAPVTDATGATEETPAE